MVFSDVYACVYVHTHMHLANTHTHSIYDCMHAEACAPVAHVYTCGCLCLHVGPYAHNEGTEQNAEKHVFQHIQILLKLLE